MPDPQTGERPSAGPTGGGFSRWDDVKAKKIFKRIAGLGAAVLMLGTLSVLGASSATAAAGGDAGTLALANVGKSAGYCADSPSTNSLGGNQFATSCAGNGGQGEYWCADFARWVRATPATTPAA